MSDIVSFIDRNGGRVFVDDHDEDLTDNAGDEEKETVYVERPATFVPADVKAGVESADELAKELEQLVIGDRARP